MPPRKYLTEKQKWQAIGMVQAGQSQNQVARFFGKSKSVISRLVTLHRQTGNVTMRRGRGRLKKTTFRQDQLIRTVALRNRFVTTPEIKREFRTATGIRLSNPTVRNRLRAAGLKASRPFKGVIMTLNHRRQRYRWAQHHQTRALRHWRHVMFSDESRFCLRFTDGRKRVWRRCGERYVRATIMEHDSYGGGSVMVWGGITYDRMTDLIVIRGNMTGQRYVNEILRPVVVPMANRIGQNFVFQDDNARPHRARVATDFLTQQGIGSLPWPAKSPDMSPMEHLWDVLGRSVRARQPQPVNLDNLSVALQEEWRRIPRATVRRLIASMPSICRACVAVRGGHTRY